jgi:hypothetical protein
VEPIRLTAPVQLLVEGHTPEVFFGALLGKLGLVERVQVHNFGGVQQLRPFLRALVAAPRFAGEVKTLGCVRDAEADARAAFASVRDALSAARLDAPSEPGFLTAGPPRTAVFILPDGRASGMLETLCLASVQGDPALGCVEAFVGCLQAAGRPLRNLTKTRAQAFLSSRGESEALVGRAAHQGHWPLDAPPFEPLRRFLREVAEV